MVPPFRILWGRPPPAVRAERTSVGFVYVIRGSSGQMRWRALLAWTAGGGCPHMSCFCVCGEFRQVFPEELAAIHHFSAAHVKQIYRQHAIFVVIAEHVGIIAFGGGNALPLLQLLHRGNQIAVAGSAFVLLGGGGLRHAGVQGTAQIRWPAFKK